MIDILSFFTAAAGLETTKWIGQAIASGVVGNSSHAAVCHAVPGIRRWLQGEGQPANHHLQRALRTAYLAATKELLENAREEASRDPQRIDDDTLAWCGLALQWVGGQSDLLKDERYQPPAPPEAWEPEHIVGAAEPDAAADVAALRDSLRRMLLGEWQSAGFRTPPECVSAALANVEIETVGVYFAHEIKTQPQVQAIFQAEAVSKILIELRAFREESAQLRRAGPEHPFFAPAAPDYFVGREEALEVLSVRLAEPGAVVPLIGMPGLGKTSLAIQFAHRRKSDFEGVLWVGCAGKTLSTCAVELAGQLGVRPEGAPEVQLREVRRLCAERHFLLVLDNVQSDEIRGLIPGGRCAVLVRECD